MVSPKLGFEVPHLELLREAISGQQGSSFLEETKQRWAPLQWILLIAALFLLVLAHTEFKSPMLVGLLVPLIFINAPDDIFNFLRGSVGEWLSLIVVLSVLYTPPIYIPAPTNLWVSILLLIVVSPPSIVSLRFSYMGTTLSFIIAAILAIQHIRDGNNDPDGPQSTFTQQKRLPTTVALMLTIAIPIVFFFY